MLYKWFQFILLLMIVFAGKALSAQNRPSFSENELSGFVRIFIESKKSGINQDSLIKDILIQTRISEEHYGALIKEAIEKPEGSRIQADATLTEAILQWNNKIASEKKAREVYLCELYAFDFNLYSIMRSAFHNDPLFQHSLVAYFEKYINELK